MKCMKHAPNGVFLHPPLIDPHSSPNVPNDNRLHRRLASRAPVSSTYDPDCICGSSFRSFPGKAPSNPVSEKYLLAHLGINQMGLIIMIGIAMITKNVVRSVLLEA